MKENPFHYPQDVADKDSPTFMRRTGGVTLLDDIALAVLPEIIKANLEKSIRDARKAKKPTEPNINPFNAGLIAYQVADGILEAREAFLKGPEPTAEAAPKQATPSGLVLPGQFGDTDLKP